MKTPTNKTPFLQTVRREAENWWLYGDKFWVIVIPCAAALTWLIS